MKAEALKLIKSEQPDFVTSEVLLERVPFIFKENWTAFRSWRSLLASQLEVDPCDIFFTGSSAAGFSLNPRKGFKDFDNFSDVDLGVISPHHFDIAWRFVRAQRRSRVDPHFWSTIQEHKTKYIYWGCIACDRTLAYLPFGARWLQALGNMARNPVTLDRDLRLRIYRDVASLRSYQSANILSLKASM